MSDHPYGRSFWIDRAAQLVVSEGWAALSDSEIGAMYGDTSWRMELEARVAQLTGKSSGRTPEWIAAPVRSIGGEELADATRQVDVLLQAAVLSLGSKTTDGQLVEAVAIPWVEIIRQLERDPEFLFKIPWRTLEEIVAGAYTQAGWPDVVLIPRSGDRGRDVIATKPGVLSVRVVDQIKAYRKGHVVTADEVRSMLGVLQTDQNVSKGLVTTTSRFAPGIETDSGLRAFMPFRLELKDGQELSRWLVAVARRAR